MPQRVRDTADVQARANFINCICSTEGKSSGLEFNLTHVKGAILPRGTGVVDGVQV
jgi:hypothetical protein